MLGKDAFVINNPSASSSGLPDHQHSASGDGGNLLNPDTVNVTSALESGQFTEIAGQLFEHLGVASPVAGSYNNVSLISTFGGAYPLMTLAITGNIIWTGIDITDFMFAGVLSKGPPVIGIINGSTIASAATWTLKDASASSSASNRYKGNGTDLVLQPGQFVWLTYDSNSSKWIASAVGGSSSIINSTPGPDADITIDAAGSIGSGITTFAESQHGHKVTSSAVTPAAISKTPSPGTSGTLQRAGHSHSIIGDQVQKVRTSIALGASTAGDVTITWPVTMSDTNYTIIATPGINDATNRTPPTIYIRQETKTATTVKIRVNNNAATAITITLDVIGIHD